MKGQCLLPHGLKMTHHFLCTPPTSAQPLGPCGSSNKLWRPGPSSPSKKDLPEGSQSCQHPWSQEMFPVATEAGPGDQGEFLGGCWLGRVVGSLWGHHCPQQGETGSHGVDSDHTPGVRNPGRPCHQRWASDSPEVPGSGFLNSWVAALQSL